MSILALIFIYTLVYGIFKKAKKAKQMQKKAF